MSPVNTYVPVPYNTYLVSTIPVPTTGSVFLNILHILTSYNVFFLVVCFGVISIGNILLFIHDYR